MSLMKLYGPRMGIDLGLQRRVLINNVIRHIHNDFRQEGGVGTLFFSAMPAVAAADGCEDESYRQPPQPPPSFGVLSSSLSGFATLDSCLTPASLLEEDVPLFFTLPSSSSSSSSSSPHHHHHLHHSPRPLPSPSSKDSFSSALEEIEELTTDTSPSPSGSFLTDFALDDILFTDIDTSMSMSGYVAAGGGGAQNQTFKMDLAELDHIMEVLVGS
ncbi:hypothetical protein LDENG_00081730 [Lucifuga dentata]|nr:hypothetical protein LDENG_00081730 [Lucifuga dentata]